MENVYSDKAVILSHALDTAIGTHNELIDNETLQNYILNFSNLNPEILKININLPDETGLKVFVSTDMDSINSGEI